MAGPLARFVDIGQREKWEKPRRSSSFVRLPGLLRPRRYRTPSPYANPWGCGLEGGARPPVVSRDRARGRRAQGRAALDALLGDLGARQGAPPRTLAAARKCRRGLG